MSRTTPALLKTVIEVDEQSFSDANLEVFITVANELVTEFCAEAGFTDVRLELIERYLACHFYAIRDPRASSESAGVSVSYLNPSVGMYFEGTTFGQQALLLDTSGALAALSKSTKDGGKGTVGVTWLGTEAEEEE